MSGADPVLLSSFLAPALGLDKASVRIRRVTDSIAVLRENEQGLSKRMLAEVAAGVRSLNEYREALHVGPPIAGGDIYCLPANMVPITEVGQTTSSGCCSCPLSLARCASASVWTVLPSPMSSARMPTRS